jgi:hypothetical protein
MSAWVLWNKTGDRHAVLQSELAFALESSYAELRRNSQEAMIHNILKQGEYSHPDSTQVRSLIKTSKQLTADVEMVLERLGQPRQTIQHLQQAQQHLRAYREKILELSDENELISAGMPTFPDTDWLVQTYENDAPADFAAIRAETKMHVALMEMAMLNFICQEAGGGRIICRGSGLDAIYQPINPRPDEQVTTEVFLTEFGQDYLLTYYLNGKVLPVQSDRVHFEVRYDQPGLYPLRFSLTKRNWLTDSTEHFEKTYLLRVR